MIVVMGTPGSGKTQRLLREFIGKHNTSIFLVPTAELRDDLRKTHRQVFEFHGIDEKRVVSLPELRGSLMRFKPKELLIDNLQWLVRTVLDLEATEIGSFSVDLLPERTDLEILSTKREKK
ncbi:hypothetical protein Bb109J_c1982 [Bdellovibrio bacteriovorus]|uniref:hypothetical protein n=1 Tax=Bdellovibrio bacteriovorus TaxID=959 RepID=UPI00045BF916|nr:hypothetical protein [Bdellovibrio bacteriovorus]AHZ84672.1 hypothetical protein EP01_06940 [Bdellovibrio bacteriovorus]BEV68562.1 hypothetical protein Bb109J_c1982 [Bdellovibrio bacteriovorus]